AAAAALKKKISKPNLRLSPSRQRRRCQSLGDVEAPVRFEFEPRRVAPKPAAGVGFNDMESVGSNQHSSRSIKDSRGQAASRQSTYQCPAVVGHEMQRDRHGYYVLSTSSDNNGVYFGLHFWTISRHGKAGLNEAGPNEAGPARVPGRAGYFGLAGCKRLLR
uniref:HELP domain-containing protein n=1 Tax=Macrostomum lignano TaxID=282301 RepID=A0A1I8F8N1_9PLAT